MKIILHIVLALLIMSWTHKNVSAQDQQPAREKQPLVLDGTEWEITLKQADNSSMTKKDKLIFKNGKFSTEAGVYSGYASCNYSISLNDDFTVWETIQSRNDGETTFWRGEIQDETLIRGMASVKSADDETIKYNFNGRLVYGELKEEVPEEKLPAVEEKAGADTKPMQDKSLTSGEEESEWWEFWK